jgi:beta-mannanase
MSKKRLTVAALIIALAAAFTVVLANPAEATITGRNLPAGGRTLMVYGQTTPDLDQFHQQVLSDSSFPAPGGVTLYTNITPGVCNGLHSTCTLDGNTDNFDQTLAEFPGAALAVGLYLSDKPSCSNQPLRAIIGRTDADLTANNLGQQYRDNLDALITYLKNTGRAVYLRIGYEFDGPWNCYNADYYKQAFRVVKQRIDALGATNVATVWQTAAYPKDGDPTYGYDFSNPNHLNAWYPGDDVVDWVGFSAFYWDNTYRQYQWACDTPTSSPVALYNAVLAFSRAHGKPAMITESTPQGYRTAELDASCTNVNQRVSLNGDWTKIGAWYDQYFGYIAANSDVIKAVSYINSNWEAITQFDCPPGATAGSSNCTDGYWGDSRIQDNANIYANFKREVQNSQFVNGTLAGRGSNWGSGGSTPPPTTPPPTPTPTPSTSPTGGGGGGGNRNPYARIEAESYDAQSGVSTVSQTGDSGGAAVGHTSNGDWVRYDNVAFAGTSPLQVTFSYSSGRATNQAFTVEFHAGSATGPVIAAPGVLGTGSWTTYQQLTYNISNFPAGTTSIAIVFKASDTADIANIDWFTFTGSQPAANPSTTPPTSPPPTTNPTGGRQLLIGQSSKASWDDWTSFAPAPAGGSVYYELKSGDWVGADHQAYASYLAGQGRIVQVGISWKDNPPGFTGGTEDQKAAQSRLVTQQLADGQYHGQFANLIAFINQYPQARFYLRLDYEVSSYYFCTDSTCSSYKNAFAAIRNYINSQIHQANVSYVYHPVRGEYATLYPGDAVVDWIGASIFANELCMPIYDTGAGGYVYNGTPPTNYDTATSQCREPYIGTDGYGNPAAIWQDWNYDGNILGMMAFAQSHNKPMIVSESGLMNMADHGTDTSGVDQNLADTWVKRLFGLVNYVGPIPNQSGTYDLSRVIQAVTYINLDFRYGWDGGSSGPYAFPVDTTWFANGRLSQYSAARSDFCAGLRSTGFGTTC